MPISGEINSRQWWEDYFHGEWQKFDGSNQTRHFMQRLVSELPVDEYETLRAGGFSILDWGCALGEGVDVLSATFPHCFAAGLDFAESAIEQARRHFPYYEFIHTADGSIPREFDVIVTSNCLEHFADPLAVVQNHLSRCRRLYAAIVPFKELEPMHEFHAFRFTEDSFPPSISGWKRLTCKAIDVNPVCWPGQQLLAVYTRDCAPER